MERIIICTSPRTGSNLLVDSVAQHPDAVSASEWFNPKAPQYARKNRNERPDDCNLLKLMIYEHRRPAFREVFNSGIRVFLFREDVDAQIASWRRACRTGMWVDGVLDSPEKFPGNARQLIQKAENLFLPECHMSVSYECLIEN